MKKLSIYFFENDEEQRALDKVNEIIDRRKEDNDITFLIELLSETREKLDRYVQESYGEDL